jgi:GxxExxY protein
MGLRGIPFKRQVPVNVVYKEHTIKRRQIDLLVDDQVVVELKAVSRLPQVATAQVLSYLKATHLRRGLLVNFSMSRLVDGIKRLVI